MFNQITSWYCFKYFLVEIFQVSGRFEGKVILLREVRVETQSVQGKENVVIFYIQRIEKTSTFGRWV